MFPWHSPRLRKGTGAESQVFSPQYKFRSLASVRDLIPMFACCTSESKSSVNTLNRQCPASASVVPGSGAGVDVIEVFSQWYQPLRITRMCLQKQRFLLCFCTLSSLPSGVLDYLPFHSSISFLLSFLTSLALLCQHVANIQFPLPFPIVLHFSPTLSSLSLRAVLSVSVFRASFSIHLLPLPSVRFQFSPPGRPNSINTSPAFPCSNILNSYICLVLILSNPSLRQGPVIVINLHLLLFPCQCRRL